jgi:hypothetical protein
MSQFAVMAIGVPEQGPSIQQMAPPVQMQQMTMPQQQQHAFIKPVSSMMGLQENSTPGYYVLQNGPQPKYIYYGTEPPQLK